MNKTAYGRFIRFVAVRIIFYSYHDEDKNEPFISGHVSLFFKALIEKLGLTYELKFIKGTQGEVIDDNNGTGLIGYLLRNESDLALMPIPVIYENYKRMRFTSTFWVTNWRIFSGRPKFKPADIFQTLQCFQIEVWIAILASLLIFPAAWNLVHRLSSNDDGPEQRTGYADKIFAAYSTLVLQARDFYGGVSRKTLYLGWLFASLWISASFSGLLLSKLSLPDPPDKLDSLADSLKNDKLILLTIDKTNVQKFIEHSANEVIRRVWKEKAKGHTIGIDSDEIVGHAMQMIDTKKKVEKALILMDHAFLQGLAEIASCDFVQNEFYMSSEIVFSELSSFAFRKYMDPILAGKIFQLAMFFFESGIQRQKFDECVWRGTPCLFQVDKPEDAVDETPLNIRILIFPMVIYSLGVLASLLSLLVRRQFYVQNYRKIQNGRLKFRQFRQPFTERISQIISSVPTSLRKFFAKRQKKTNPDEIH